MIRIERGNEIASLQEISRAVRQVYYNLLKDQETNNSEITALNQAARNLEAVAANIYKSRQRKKGKK